MLNFHDAQQLAVKKAAWQQKPGKDHTDAMVRPTSIHTTLDKRVKAIYLFKCSSTDTNGAAAK
ncbi:MAG: hypothetical protein B6D76_18345 [gamma proteobacterium symbiont of Stewartia floridana]|nr:MAG: hypothetical protein B6D76_18345 [gamma proteobacterium symbiont of Stewartia floridana]RLW57234.1 MAG: hypothetical protein B6D75_18355 [gamma proteobacterium symbiont of Stewartia floridana]RLW66867.1 MAG: hypothetical protein B6D73_01055 [gamma proteobacterium symbiont of Stewartia floridana]